MQRRKAMVQKARMRRRSPGKALEYAIDREHSIFIRRRDKRCVICGCAERLECGHLFTRAAMSTRWDIGPDGNCHAECHACNMLHEADAVPFDSWYEGKFGAEAWLALRRRHNKVKRWTRGEKESLLKWLMAENGREQ